MNINTNYNERTAELKDIQLGTIDVKDRVMEQIYSLSKRSKVTNKAKHFGIKGLPVWVSIMLAFFLITSVSVSAAIVLDWKWNGIQLTIANPVEKSQSTDSKLGYQERIELGLLENSEVWKKVTLPVAEKAFSYTLLRPNKDYREMEKMDSFGIISQVLNYLVKSPNELWLGGVYDIYEKGQHHVIVRQDLDKLLTGSLLNPDKKLSMNYDSSFEKIQATEQMLIMYRKGDIENELMVSYKSEDNQVISLELTGSKGVTKEELLKLAEAYTES